MKKLLMTFLLIILSTVIFSDYAFAESENACSMESMQKEYLGGSVDSHCWYCKIVIAMTNAYLKAAAAALPASIELGKLCAKLGFMIWLAYYILQQVSSVNQITPGKMLQEILIMGFKVSLAYYGAGLGMSLLRDFFINPIVDLGVSYGSELLDQLMPSDGAINNMVGR